MYRYNKFTRILAAVLALFLLTGCTSPSQVVMMTTATTTPLVTTKSPTVTAKAPISTTTAPATTTAAQKSDPAPDFGLMTMPSGDVYPCAAGTLVTDANYPAWYASVSQSYNSWEYPYSHDNDYKIYISLPFEEDVATGETLYLVNDAAVSETIVTRIIEQATYLAESGLPKMRGQQKYAEMETEDVCIYVYLQTVVNHVASFVINRIFTLRDADGAPYWINDTTPLNFDLNTGDMVPLAALFVDDYDYKTRINAEIEAYLMENAQIDESQYVDYQPRLLAPFAGIRDDQPFYLVGQSLFIMLGFNNPELYLPGPDYGIGIPLHKLADCLVLFDRYATEEPLTASTEYLLTSIDGTENGVGGVIDFGNSEKYQYATVTYMADGLTDAAQTAFAKWTALEQFPIQSFKVMADADIAVKYGYCRFYEQSSYTSVAGGYAVMTYQHYLGGFEQSDLNMDRDAYYCWNLKEDRPAVISDFFAEGYDYVAALTECLRSRQYRAKLLKYVDSIEALIDLTPQPLDQTMKPDVLMLYPTAYGFNFRIVMSGSDKWGELYEEYGGIIGGYIEYSELGYENLTMFS